MKKAYNKDTPLDFGFVKFKTPESASKAFQDGYGQLHKADNKIRIHVINGKMVLMKYQSAKQSSVQSASSQDGSNQDRSQKLSSSKQDDAQTASGSEQDRSQSASGSEVDSIHQHPVSFIMWIGIGETYRGK